MHRNYGISVFIAVFALILSGCGKFAAPTAQTLSKPFRVAVVLPSSIKDHAYSEGMYDGLMHLQEEMGAGNFQFAYSENMFVVDDAAAAVRDYASQGYDLVIAHGQQYGAALPAIAADFPTTSFAWGASTETFSKEGIKNIFAYSISAEQGGYVNGFIAGKLTKSNVIGLIAPFESGNNKLYLDGFKAGVNNSNPNAKVEVVLTGSFTDIAMATQAATTLVDSKADIMSGTSQSVVGAIGVAESNNIPWFSDSYDQSPLAPSVIVASQVYQWKIPLKQMVALIKGGTLGDQVIKLDLSNSGIDIAFNPNYLLAQDIRSQADQLIKDLAAGSFKIELPK